MLSVSVTSTCAAKEKKTVSSDSALSFDNLSGVWDLKYRNHYGYSFRFYRNYKAIVVLYLHNHALVFKGVYTIEGRHRIRINIFEMKRDKNVRRVNIYSKFVKTKSSSFIFSGERDGRKLLLKPEKIVIDGNNSDGYFEPVIKLRKVG